MDIDDVIAKLLREVRICSECKKQFGNEKCWYCKPRDVYAPAPDGQIYVCGACGKTSKTLACVPDSSWDESCMLNAVLCYEEKTDGQWTAVRGE